MPDIDALLEVNSKKKFKKSSYRPWNYLEEIQKEEDEKQQHQEPANVLELENDVIIAPNILLPSDVIPINQDTKLNDAAKDNLANIAMPEVSQIKAQSKKEQQQPEISTVSPLYSMLRLSGHQKIIFAFILERCLTRGFLSSGVVTSEILTSITDTSLNMVNTSIQRLVEKKLIFRENGKRGRGGFYCFGLSQEVKDAAIEFRRLASLDITELRSNESQFKTFDPIQNEGKKMSALGLPDEWEELDIEPLQHIGFSRSHLVQLYKQGELEPHSVQDSIYHFAYDLKYNNKAVNITKSGPIGYFMGILKRTVIYNAPDNYESPKDKALRELLERKKTEKEKRDTMIKDLIDIAFTEWQSKLSQDEKDKFIPEEIRRGRLNAAKVASLKTYFTEHVWPQIAPKEITIFS